ncbi:hypothetical protein BV20DRAFT_960787 [Pilatotrama ljubarskyi]|nr:hypothetical protein BV20DRAFT_960787 [Pilatotrama ljubarskyi]
MRSSIHHRVLPIKAGRFESKTVKRQSLSATAHHVLLLASGSVAAIANIFSYGSLLHPDQGLAPQGRGRRLWVRPRSYCQRRG